MDYLSLLEQVLQHQPYCEWKPSGKDKYRDYRGDSNPSIELSCFGLFDHAANQSLQSLASLAISLDIIKPENKIPIDKDAWRSQAVDKERQEYQAKLNEMFVDAKRKAWRKNSLPVLWGYFVEERCIWPENKKGRVARGVWLKQFSELMWGIKAHVIQYTSDDVAGSAGSGEKKPVTEIRVPMLGEAGEVVQLMRIGVAARAPGKNEEHKGKWRKTFKRFKYSADKPRAIILGSQSSSEAVIIEGLEDALTLYSCAKFKLNKGIKYIGEDKLFVVVGGSAHIPKAINLASGGGSASDNGVTRMVEVVCDNDEKKAGIKATHALGGMCQRLLPKDVGVDANAVLMSHGVVGTGSGSGGPCLKRWVDELVCVSWASLNNALENEENKDIIAAQKDVHAFMHIKAPWTNAGAVQVFLEQYGNRVKRTEDGQWRVFDGRQWQIDPEGGQVMAMIFALQPVYEKIAREIIRRDKDSESVAAKKCIKFGEKLLMHGHNAVTQALKSSKTMMCKVDDFDKRKDILNLQNGILMLDSGELVEHAPEFMCSRIAGTSWRVGAKCPAFDAFLNDIMCEDADLVMYKERQLGYLLSGDTSEKSVFYHYGPGGDNGKSTETDIIAAVMGEYCTTVSENLFLEQRFGNEQMYELSQLPGIRLAICGEVDESKAWSEAMVKKISGGTDKITAREIRQAPFRFLPVFKLLIHANNLPRIKAGDNPMMNRLHVIPYDMELQPGTMDKGLGDRLHTELEGILQKMHKGYLAWKAMKNLNPPAAVLEARDEYKEGVFEELGLFVGECCEVCRDEETKMPMLFDENGEELVEMSLHLYSAYKKWCKRNDLRWKTLTAFGRGMGELGFRKSRKLDDNGRKVTYRTGLRLNGVADDFEDADIPF